MKTTSKVSHLRPTRATESNESPNPKTLLAAYRLMVLARKVDEKAIVLYKQNKCHFQIGCAGHEAIQVAASTLLKPSYDWFYPYYRDMALCVGLGMTPRELLLNALNKADDPNSGGRQMPMHYGHKQLNIVSQSSPTGTQYLQAIGAAVALRYRGGNQVVYVSSGEGTTAQGAYHEALNWAAREKLPIIFLIQDNKYAISVHISEQIAGGSVAKISRGYEGLTVVEVDGTNYLESHRVLSDAVHRARSGGGPTVVDAQVVRLESHSISDNQLKYREQQELDNERKRDPITLMRQHLLKQQVATSTELDRLEQELQVTVDADTAWAELQPDPAPHTVEDHVLVLRDPGAGVTEAPATGEELFLVDALNRALDEELERNPEMIVYGQDVAGGKGGVFGVTTGLTSKYGEQRCFNSPLAEDSIVGSAVGLATLGMRPVVEIQFGDYVWTAMMQLRDELAMMNYRSNGAFTCPAVVRIPVGGYIHGGLYHSQNVESIFAHFPGVIVLYPSNAADAKGLLKSAIRSPDPVLFLEHKGLYRQVYAKAKVGGVNDLTPIGRAKVIRTGSDATVVTWGALVQRSLLAAERLAENGRQVEVIDLRTISPLDVSSIISSVKQTGRLLVAHEDVLFAGFGAEVSAIVAERAFEYLDAPIKRIGGRFTPVPHAPVLEELVLPQTVEIERALIELLRY